MVPEVGLPLHGSFAMVDLGRAAGGVVAVADFKLGGRHPHDMETVVFI